MEHSAQKRYKMLVRELVPFGKGGVVAVDQAVYTKHIAAAIN